VLRGVGWLGGLVSNPSKKERKTVVDRIVLLMDPLSNNCVQTLTHLSWREKQIAVRIKILLKYLRVKYLIDSGRLSQKIELVWTRRWKSYKTCFLKFCETSSSTSSRHIRKGHCLASVLTSDNVLTFFLRPMRLSLFFYDGRHFPPYKTCDVRPIVRSPACEIKRTAEGQKRKIPTCVQNLHVSQRGHRCLRRLLT
jgi:hypothetical protein